MILSITSLAIGRVRESSSTPPAQPSAKVSKCSVSTTVPALILAASAAE